MSTPDLTSRAQRINYAAKVIQETIADDETFSVAYRQLAANGTGLKALLSDAAKRADVKDRAAIEAEFLASFLRCAYYSWLGDNPVAHRSAAQQLIAAGWERRDAS